MSREPREGEELFSAAFDGDLSPSEQEAFQRMLREDPKLRSGYEEFHAMMVGAPDLYRTAAVPDLLPGVRKRLKQRKGPLRGDRLGQLRGRGRIQPLWLACLVVTLLLLLWLVFSALETMAGIGNDTSPNSRTIPAADSDR